MTKPFHLQQLEKLAEDKSEGAARLLARFKLAWQEAQDKLDLLQGYRAEYGQRMRQPDGQAFSIQQLRDFQAFIAKLEVAIEAQMKEVASARQQWERAQAEWGEREREANAYRTLRQRHEQTERKAEEKRDQRTQDEFASNLHRRAGGETED